MPVPGQFLPRSSGPHRVACKALYRSLLESAARIQIHDDESTGTQNRAVVLKTSADPLKHFIRKKFKQNAHHDSPRFCVKALQAGYAANNLLHAASMPTPNLVALRQLQNLISLLTRRASLSRSTCTQRPPSAIAAKASAKALLRPHPSASHILSTRPLPHERLSSGKRHVPNITIAQFLPFLRFKKPQSAYLSRVLGEKIEQRQRRHDWLDRLEGEAEEGQGEGVWEGNVLDNSDDGGLDRDGREVGDVLGRDWGDEWGWSAEPFEARKRVTNVLYHQARRAEGMGEKMIALREREKGLWESEGREARHRKRQASMKQKVKKRRESEM